ncbi:MAG: hypothetical protein ACTSYR_04100 [Candidatus Odinarchaeia archaeon]
MKAIEFKPITLRKEISSRGGGIEISLDGLGFLDNKMTVYQNYLGGGMLGKVASDCTVKDWKTNVRLQEISEQLKQHYHGLTNPEDEFSSQSYEQNQNLGISAY